MQIEPHDNKDGYRCWLSASEQDLIAQYYDQYVDDPDPKKQLAIELMLDGLRSEETTRVAKQDFRRLDADEEAYKLRVRESKTGYREAPVSNDTRQRAVMLANARGLRQDEPLIDVTPRTVQRWTEAAAEYLADPDDNDDYEGDEDWAHVTAHDLRRSWATETYYRLNATPVAKSTIMRWGGWTDEDTFERNYLGREPDHLCAELMETAGLR